MLIYAANWADRRSLGRRRPETALRGLAADLALACAVAATDVYGAWDEAHNPVQGDMTLKLPPVPSWAYLLVAFAALALLGRRKWPLSSFIAVTGLTFAYTCLGYNDGAPLLAVAVSLYSLATVINPKPAWAALALAVVACEGALIAFEPFGITIGPATAAPFELAAGAGVGFFVASRRAQAAQVRERAELAERNREEEARRRVEAERLRIARELHDVVAHSMATVNVQAGVALHLLREPGGAADEPGKPIRLERAMEAMEAVRVTSKEALRELRGILNLLRSSSEEAEPTSPAPRLAQVGDLLDVTTRAGLPVELRVVGRPRDLPPMVDLAAYRIIQEALTNTLRHAGPARAIVELAYAPDRLVVQVADNGRGAPANLGMNGNGNGSQVGASQWTSSQPDSSSQWTSSQPDGSQPNREPGNLDSPGTGTGGGKGLLGMRERVQALGGSLEAGPLDTGGFHVRAELPCQDEAPLSKDRLARNAGRRPAPDAPAPL